MRSGPNASREKAHDEETLRRGLLHYSSPPGRGLNESVDWQEFGELARNVCNIGFALRVPGDEKCILNYSVDGDWATPAFFSIPRLSEVDIRVVQPWIEHAAPGVTSVTLLLMSEDGWFKPMGDVEPEYRMGA